MTAISRLREHLEDGPEEDRALTEAVLITLIARLPLLLQTTKEWPSRSGCSDEPFLYPLPCRLGLGTAPVVCVSWNANARYLARKFIKRVPSWKILLLVTPVDHHHLAEALRDRVGMSLTLDAEPGEVFEKLRSVTTNERITWDQLRGLRRRVYGVIGESALRADFDLDAVAVDAVRNTRPQTAEFVSAHAERADEFSNALAFGASLRASRHALQLAAARAMLHGRRVINREDLKSVFTPALEHRLVPHHSAQVSGFDFKPMLERSIEHALAA